MNDAPRQTLRALVARHGPGLCSDARRCEALLRDHAGAHRREVNTLVSALKERVPLDLLAAQSAMPRSLLVARLAKRLEDQLALTPEAARWAVDSWALALGVVTEAEVEEREEREKQAQKDDRSAPPSSSSDAPRPAFGEGADDEERKRRAAQSQPTQPTQPTQPARPTQPTQPPRPATTPPPPRQQQQQGGQPPPRATTPAPKTSPPPAAARPSGRPAPPTVPPSPWGRTWFPVMRRGASPPASANTTAGGLPSPAPTPDPPPARRRGGKLRGCTVGCLLVVLLALALFVGGPFVLSVLREEQQRRNLEPSPVLSP